MHLYNLRILTFSILAMSFSTMFLTSSFTKLPSAAVVKAGLPGEDAELVTAISTQLKTAGYTVTELDAEGLSDAARLTADLLVLPNSAILPGRATVSVDAYLRKGGDIIALNAPMWQESVINTRGEWLTQEKFRVANAGTLTDNTLFHFKPDDLKGWQRSTDKPEVKASHETMSDGPGTDRRSLHVTVSDMSHGWDTYQSPAIDNAFPADHTLTVFSAKGTPGLKQLSIEWMEKDGSRWTTTVQLTTGWRQYVLRPSDFQFWNSVPTRGGADDKLNPQNASRISFVMSPTYSGITPNPQEYWVGPIGTAPMTPEFEGLLASMNLPTLDTLSPGYKFFDISEASALNVRQDQTIISQAKIPVPSRMRSPHQRPEGGGFDKDRKWRWIPLLEARSKDGEWRGTPVTLTVNTDGPYKGGAWASFGVEDPQWYKSPEVLGMIRQLAEHMKDGVYMVDGGTNFYTYFDDQKVKLGLRMANLGGESHTALTARVTLTETETGKRVIQRTWNLSLKPGATKAVSSVWKPGNWPKEGLTATAEIIDNGKVIDRVTHNLHVWEPSAEKKIVTIIDGDMMLDGKRWRAYGVNYMPSTCIASEDWEYLAYWLRAMSYDSEAAERDLKHIKDIGFNSVSIFLFHESMQSQNLLDVLRIIKELGLKANLSLRPGTPMNFEWKKMKEMIEYYRLKDCDTVFAYDLAWEPMIGTHEMRKEWDPQWQEWIIERYGSLANAEHDWKYPVPRDESGKVTNPKTEDFTDKGLRMTSAYRRFLDTLLYKKYSAARKLVQSVDPNHPVSFRMADTGNPTWRRTDALVYDFPYLAGAVDIMEPEAYGRIGDWEQVKPGRFEFEYSRWAAPHLPIFWAEAGKHAWDSTTMSAPPYYLQAQADFYRDFSRMMIESGFDGVFYWWYPGGYRWDEKSDYGIINPDGTDRPVTKVIRENADKLLNGPSAKPVDHWIEIDRDLHPSGLGGIYDTAKAEFWDAIDKGLTPGLRTAGTGTTSADCPLIAVGNTPINGINPPKFLDASIDLFEILDANGRWKTVKKGDKVTVNASKPVIGRITLMNLGEAKWITEDGRGAVYITSEGSNGVIRTKIPSSVPHLSSITVNNVELTHAGFGEAAQITIGLLADRRTRFGERFNVTLIAK
ncbi:MAG: glycoside hydrolase 5 family protein [Armatimonadota bacterium]